MLLRLVMFLANGNKVLKYKAVSSDNGRQSITEHAVVQLLGCGGK